MIAGASAGARRPVSVGRFEHRLKFVAQHKSSVSLSAQLSQRPPLFWLFCLARSARAGVLGLCLLLVAPSVDLLEEVVSDVEGTWPRQEQFHRQCGWTEEGNRLRVLLQ